MKITLYYSYYIHLIKLVLCDPLCFWAAHCLANVSTWASIAGRRLARDGVHQTSMS
jgi:hypothetical protein